MTLRLRQADRIAGIIAGTEHEEQVPIADPTNWPQHLIVLACKDEVHICNPETLVVT